MSIYPVKENPIGLAVSDSLIKSMFFFLQLILEDKTMDDKLMYIQNDDKQNCYFKSLDTISWTNQSKFDKST